jgi:hypothetical protein
VLGAAPIVLPFLVLTPGGLWHDVVVVQSGRPAQAKGLTDRLGAVGLATALHLPPSGLVAILLAIGIGALLLAVVLGPLLFALARRVAPLAWPDPVWWGILAAVQLAALAVAPSYYSHYGSFVTPALCLLLGAGAGRLATVARARGGRPARAGVAAIVAVAVLAGLTLTVTRPPLPASGRVDNAALAEFAAAHRCVWVRNPSYLQVADAMARQVRARCPATMDLVGAWLVLVAGGTVPGSPATNLDDLVLGQLMGSDGALLWEGHPAQGLGTRSRVYLKSHFRRVGATGEIEMWSRTRP